MLPTINLIDLNAFIPKASYDSILNRTTCGIINYFDFGEHSDTLPLSLVV